MGKIRYSQRRPLKIGKRLEITSFIMPVYNVSDTRSLIHSIEIDSVMAINILISTRCTSLN